MMRRLSRFMPSPAMVVALAALVMSLGGSAYALVVTGKTIRNNTVTGFDVRQRSLTGNDVKRDKIGGGSVKESTLGVVPSSLVAHGGARFAVVDAGGQLVRGRDISSVARTAAGRYQVILNADVRGCGYYATIGDPSAAGPPKTARPASRRSRRTSTASRSAPRTTTASRWIGDST